uniref:Uncharacterized protein n=1 Tax=Acrobeloides nanus TaxID=290746 RepID=A0A914D6C5_9BILA
MQKSGCLGYETDDDDVIVPDLRFKKARFAFDVNEAFTSTVAQQNLDVDITAEESEIVDDSELLVQSFRDFDDEELEILQSGVYILG